MTNTQVERIPLVRAITDPQRFVNDEKRATIRNTWTRLLHFDFLSGLKSSRETRVRRYVLYECVKALNSTGRVSINQIDHQSSIASSRLWYLPWPNHQDLALDPPQGPNLPQLREVL